MLNFFFMLDFLFMLDFFFFGGELGPARSLRDDRLLSFVADASRQALAATSRGSSLVL